LRPRLESSIRAFPQTNSPRPGAGAFLFREITMQREELIAMILVVVAVVIIGAVVLWASWAH
jgi:hypothetical protein